MKEWLIGMGYGAQAKLLFRANDILVNFAQTEEDHLKKAVVYQVAHSVWMIAHEIERKNA